VTGPRLEYEPVETPRMEVLPAAAPDTTAPGTRAPRLGTPALMLTGVSVLLAGFTALGAANFVADQFARAEWLGWVTAGVAATGFGLVGAGVWRELRALWALDHVDHLRTDLLSGDARRVMAAAAAWAARTPDAESLAPALRAVNDPDAALALLRAGPGRTLREAADAQSRAAAVQVVAGIAAVPSPTLDTLFVAWRGIRLVRQVAVIYGVRPGLLGTLALLRRTAMAATFVGAAEVAGNTVAHALLSSPFLAKALGEAAGAGVAARRMLVLGRAAAAACDPVPPA
jgi:putative membrane protein